MEFPCFKGMYLLYDRYQHCFCYWMIHLVFSFIRLIERARRTVRGSADDIGWLQRDPEMPPVEDGTDRFNKILEDIGYMD